MNGTVAWRECNRRPFTLSNPCPGAAGEFSRDGAAFLAVICGCHAGLYRQALHDIYIPRIQRGDASFAVNVLGARETVLSALVHFFADGRWEGPVETGVGNHRLSSEDQLIILMQAAVYLAATRSAHAPEARICNERAEALCRLLNRPRMSVRRADGSMAPESREFKVARSDADRDTHVLANASAQRFFPFNEGPHGLRGHPLLFR